MNQSPAEPVVRKISNGLYSRDDGTLFIDAVEYCRELNLEPTQENQRRVGELFADIIREKLPEAEFAGCTDMPTPRPTLEEAFRCPVCRDFPPDLTGREELPSADDPVFCWQCAQVMISNGATLQRPTEEELAKLRQSARWPEFQKMRAASLEARETIKQGPEAAGASFKATVQNNLLPDWRRAPRPRGLIVARAWLEETARYSQNLRTCGREGVILSDLVVEGRLLVQAFVDDEEKIQESRSSAAKERPSVLDSLEPWMRDSISKLPSTFFRRDEKEPASIRFFLFSATGVLPFEFRPDERWHEDAIAAYVRDVCGKLDPIAVVMLSEAWVGKAVTAEARREMAAGRLDLEDLAKCHRLGIERREVLRLTIETLGGSEGHMFPIERTPTGRILGKREPGSAFTGGRFSRLLKPQPAKVN